MFGVARPLARRKSLFSGPPRPRRPKIRSDNLIRGLPRIPQEITLDSLQSVVIIVLMYPRTVKVRSSSGTVNEYVRVVEAYREGGKVKQRVVADLGRKDLLIEVLPKLRRLLTGEAPDPADPRFGEAPDWGPVLVVRALFDQLGLWDILDRSLGQAKGVPFADRAFVLVANRLIAPASEHGLAGWLETDFVSDRKGRRFIPHWHQRRRVRVHPRQLDAWYRTLDQLHAAKDQIEVALYRHLRDLFSFKPDLVLYDITSTSFEGAGPHDFAKHGYSRDGKSQNVQVIVGVVMVAGWPVAHHVWAGNRIDGFDRGLMLFRAAHRSGGNRDPPPIYLRPDLPPSSRRVPQGPQAHPHRRTTLRPLHPRPTQPLLDDHLARRLRHPAADRLVGHHPPGVVHPARPPLVGEVGDRPPHILVIPRPGPLPGQPSQLLQHPPRPAHVVLQAMARLLQPRLLPTGVAPIQHDCRPAQVLRRMPEVGHLHVGVPLQERPVPARPVGD